MPSVPTPTTSGIITDDSGERHIPESTRADGSVRKAIKIRPGYKPAEDAVLYKNRTAESFRNRHKGGVIGAEEASTSSTDTAAASTGSAAANKNAKRREARKKAAAAAGNSHSDDKEHSKTAKLATAPPAHFFEGIGGRGKEETDKAEEADPDAEKKKKARNLTKKLKQAKELQEKKEGGQPLLPEQIAKVIKINELVRELSALGFDADAELLNTTGQSQEEAAVKQEAITKENVEEKAAPA